MFSTAIRLCIVSLFAMVSSFVFADENLVEVARVYMAKDDILFWSVDISTVKREGDYFSGVVVDTASRNKNYRIEGKTYVDCYRGLVATVKGKPEKFEKPTDILRVNVKQVICIAAYDMGLT